MQRGQHTPRVTRMGSTVCCWVVATGGWLPASIRLAMRLWGHLRLLRNAAGSVRATPLWDTRVGELDCSTQLDRSCVDRLVCL